MQETCARENPSDRCIAAIPSSPRRRCHRRRWRRKRKTPSPARSRPRSNTCPENTYEQRALEAVKAQEFPRGARDVPEGRLLGQQDRAIRRRHAVHQRRRRRCGGQGARHRLARHRRSASCHRTSTRRSATPTSRPRRRSASRPARVFKQLIVDYGDKVTLDRATTQIQCGVSALQRPAHRTGRIQHR